MDARRSWVSLPRDSQTADGLAPFNGLGASASPAPLRHALRALASEPDFFRAPREAIARLRPRVDANYGDTLPISPIPNSNCSARSPALRPGEGRTA
jgi:hypothetical protein